MLTQWEQIRKDFVKRMFSLNLNKSLRLSAHWYTLVSETVDEINKISLGAEFKVVKYRNCIKITKIKE